jgi:hypothetical protein
MKYLRHLALSLMVILALGAASGSVASAALPQFAGVIPQKFESKLKPIKKGIAVQLETIGKKLVTCESGKNQGEVAELLPGFIGLSFRIFLGHCSTEAIKVDGKAVPCTTAGAAPGEIIMTTSPESLIGSLGYITKTAVGLSVVTSDGGPVMDFTCTRELEFVVRGSVIGKIVPINSKVSPPEHFTVRFAQKAGKQNPKKFAGEPKDVLETSINSAPFEESGLAMTDELFFEQPLEILA